MKMSFERRGTLGIVRVEESRIDASVAIQFKDQFRTLTDGVKSDIVLDLSTVEFLDSSGLGAVVAVRKILSAGSKLELAGLTPSVDKVMTLTRMNSVFPIHRDLDAALLSHGGVAG